MKDHLGREIDYLRISVTDRCNLRCIYCMPAEGVEWKSHNEMLRIEEIARVARIAAEEGIRKVRLTGGEPLVKKGIVSLITDIKAAGIKDVSLTTNGILLPRMAQELKDAGLDRVNISLDTLDAQKYREITRLGNIEDVFAAIDAALEYGFHPVKVNAVAVRSENQDFLEFAKMSIERPLHVRFIEYMPVGESSGGSGSGWDIHDTIPSDELRQIINEAAAAEGLPALEPVAKDDAPGGGGPAKYWKFPGAQGTVGFISAVSNHFCAQCNRLRLTADGKIRPCLFSDEEIDVKAALQGSDDDVRAALYAALHFKPDAHHHKEGTDRRMSQIGG